MARSASPGRRASPGPALPARPVAPAGDARGDRLVGADQAGDEAVARPARRQGDVEPVLLRHRVEVEDQPVAAGEARRGEGARVEADLGAAVGDLDPAVEAEQVPPPGHRRIDQQPADAQVADVDVDVGQQRRIGIAGAQRGQPAQPRLGNVELADVDMVAKR